jgi:hypothetical protein
MMRTLGILAVACLGFAAVAQAQNTTADNRGNCKVVHLKPGEHAPSGTISSSVNAGGGKVSGSTTGGNSVTVHSGSGSASSMVTTGSSGSGSSTTVTSANGDCTIYINPGKK